MTYESTLAIARVIQRCPEHQADVLSCRHEVTWPDGSRIGLHPVRQHGADAMFLRAVHVTEGATGYWLLLDLRRLAPKLAEELPRAPTRDQPGTVLYTLRATFHSATLFLHAARFSALDRWVGPDRAPEPRPKQANKPRMHFTSGDATPLQDAGNRRFFPVEAGAEA